MHFSFTYPTPVLPPYLFDADLTSVIAVPTAFTVVPGSDQTIHLNWGKNANTTDPNNDLYAEVYRSTDLETWALVAQRQWLNYDYYTDDAILNGIIYYYKVRFVRLDPQGVPYTQSEYTLTLSGRATNLLGFEPQDAWANKFLRYLLQALPGTRIYDSTEAATFSADVQLWQTTCRITDGFKVTMDGSVVETQPADPLALGKRPISFVVGKKKQVKIKGQDTITGDVGEEILVNSYLIHTFLMGYAQQFMALNELYLQLVTNKFENYAQVFTRGFTPSVTDRKDPSFAELYRTFGTYLRLQPLKSQTPGQGLRRYQQVLRDSFTNLNNTGKTEAIHQACKDVLGISTQHLLEYYKQHWWKTDREQKVYCVPSGTDPYQYATGLPWALANNNVLFNLNDDRFTAFVEYVVDPSGIGPTGAGEGWLEVAGSGADDPYNYIFRAHISSGVTTGNDILSLFLGDPTANSLITATPSGGASAPGVIYSGADAELLRVHSLWAGWENTLVNMYGHKYQLQDAQSSLASSTDYAVDSVTLSNQIPNIPIPSNVGYPLSGVYAADPGLAYISHYITPDMLLVSRDDNNEGVGFGTLATLPSGPDINPLVYGEKRALIKLGLTVSKQQWITQASLTLTVQVNTSAGYLRLYRITKPYTSPTVCWNFRNKTTLPPSTTWIWDGSSYVTDPNAEDWVTANWETAGAEGPTDAVFLKEFYVPRVDNGSPTQISVDITDVIQNIYKYETSRLNMGSDLENILNTGFMITAEAMDNRSLTVLSSHSDMTFRPSLSWKKLIHGHIQLAPNQTKYFYMDGTARYGRMLVLQADEEPVSYIKTVNERIYRQDIKLTDDITVVLNGAPPTAFTAGARIFGQTSRNSGRISTVAGNTLFVLMDNSIFTSGETLQLLADKTITAVIQSLAYTGNKYIRLSRVPVSNSLLRVFHVGSYTTPAVPPNAFPDYTPWTEAGPGISPVFVANPTGSPNYFFTQDADERDKLYLNTTADLATIGDVVVTYQYMYDYILMGRVQTDSDSIRNIDGCSRVGEGLITQREDDYQYKSELYLPAPSEGLFPDISGDTTADEYSDHNIGVLCSAIGNIRRLDGAVDVFKYGIEGKPFFRFGQQYHTFFERT